MTTREPAAPIPLRPRRPCPICGRPSTRETHPFCSRRCAEVDLNRWLSGSYVVPGRSLNEDDGDDTGGESPK